MKPWDEAVAMKQVVLERLRFAYSVRLPEANRVVDVYRLFDAREMVVKIEQAVWARALCKAHQFDFPADWWQALKHRWFPRWALRRWPVRFASFDLTPYHAYPEMTMPHGQRAVFYYEAMPVERE